MHYLSHEARENNTSVSFFNSNTSGISSGEVAAAIDGNVKGLRKNEVKFYSLVISPSHYELSHLEKRGKTVNPSESIRTQSGSGVDEKLTLYARHAMENYAANFSLKDGKKLSSTDLVWFGVIHHNRQYKGTHRQVKEGKVLKGDLKPGMNAHVHIIVSKRDALQQINLNPQGTKERFRITKWQARNEQTFDRLFAYHREIKQPVESSSKLSSEQFERFSRRISNKLSIINNMLEKPDRLIMEEVEKVAQKKGYKETFFYNLSRLETTLRKGGIVHEPLHLLEHNKDRKRERLESGKLGADLEKTFKILSNENTGMSDELSILEARPRFRSRPQPAKPGMSRGL
jgi:hypothetical protein